MNAICLVLDRLHLGYLGAYGNSWIGTPAIDRLASESAVFDQAMIDSPELDRLYRSYWQGVHALAPNPEGEPGLAAMLGRRGVETVLMTDDPAVAALPLANEFGLTLELEGPNPSGLAEQVEETHLARCFAQMIDRLGTAKAPFLLWCHWRALAAPWDAPLDFRLAYVDEEDPFPPETDEVPSRMLEEDYDPDELLGVVQSYSGQVALLDTCVAALLEFLRDSPLGRETTLVLTSPRGFPLGEHRRIGAVDDALYAELTHVPLVIRFPDGRAAGARSQALVEPADLWATLLDCWKVPDRPARTTARSLLPIVDNEVESLRDRLVIRGEGERAILSPAWCMRSAEHDELFARPDDLWQANDVANRCPDCVESRRTALAQYAEAVNKGEDPYAAPLEETLVEGV